MTTSKRAQFDASSDDQAGPPAPQRGPMRCVAVGCPMHCSVNISGNLCSWHDREAANPQLWPQITSELWEAIRRGDRPQYPKPWRAEPMPASMRRPDHLNGARSLRWREEQGERLTPVQREFWRLALRRELEAERAQQQQEGESCSTT